MGYNYIILGLNRYKIIIPPGIELGNEFELWETMALWEFKPGMVVQKMQKRSPRPGIEPGSPA